MAELAQGFMDPGWLFGARSAADLRAKFRRRSIDDEQLFREPTARFDSETGLPPVEFEPLSQFESHVVAALERAGHPIQVIFRCRIRFPFRIVEFLEKGGNVTRRVVRVEAQTMFGARSN